MEKLSKFNSLNTVLPDAVMVTKVEELDHDLRLIDLDSSRPVLVIVGGASQLGEKDMGLLKQVFEKVIVPVAETCGAAVIDGATDAGVMRLIGQARSASAATFPLIGVAAVGTIILPNENISSTDAAPLEPNHTHFVFVPGSNWGDESPWIARVASVLADGAPSLTLVINGGEVTWKDVSCSVSAGRATLVLAGSGRTADLLAAALRGEPTDARGKTLAASGLLQAINIKTNFEGLAPLISELLSNGGNSNSRVPLSGSDVFVSNE